MTDTTKDGGLFAAWAEKAIAEHRNAETVIAAQQKVVDQAWVAIKEYQRERGSKPWLNGMLNLLAELSHFNGPASQR